MEFVIKNGFSGLSDQYTSNKALLNDAAFLAKVVTDYVN
jgi:hypothetical protein